VPLKERKGVIAVIDDYDVGYAVMVDIRDKEGLCVGRWRKNAGGRERYALRGGGTSEREG
jgi:hypothetical protein